MTIANSNFKFHDEKAEDPDCIVKQCCLLLIATVTEADVGLKFLWKRGMSGGHHEYTHIGQCIPLNAFNSFQSEAP